MAEGKEPPVGTIRPTGLRVLATTFVVGTLLGYVFAVVSERVSLVAPRVEWTSVLALAAIAGVISGLAWSTYQAVHRQRRLIPPHRAVSTLLLAKASSMVGALLSGGYLGFGLHFVDRMEAELPRERVIRSVVAAVAGVAIMISGLLLERACRVPGGDDE